MRPLVQSVRDLLRGLQRAPQAVPPAALDDPENPENWVGLDYVHDRVLAQVEEQSELWENADGRLRLILGVNGIVFAVALGLLPRGSAPSPAVPADSGASLTEPQYLAFAVGVCAMAGLLLFAVAGVVAVVAYWPRDFN